MNKNNKIQLISILIIIISVLVSGYILINPNNKSSDQSKNAISLAPIVDGKQFIKMTVLALEYSPSYFKVKAGVPVKWEITSSGQPSCASGALISSLLPNGSVYLDPNQGKITVVEFTSQNPGIYKFSCPMNMVRGTIEVIN